MKKIEIYELRDYDGGDGRGNRSNGFFTRDEAVAKEWARQGIGNDYVKITGVLIESLAEMAPAQREITRQKALLKLTAAEREALGFGEPQSDDDHSPS